MLDPEEHERHNWTVALSMQCTYFNSQNADNAHSQGTLKYLVACKIGLCSQIPVFAGQCDVTKTRYNTVIVKIMYEMVVRRVYCEHSHGQWFPLQT